MCNTTLSSGVELCMRDSGDCICTQLESEPARCFFLGILNGDAMLTRQKEHNTLRPNLEQEIHKLTFQNMRILIADAGHDCDHELPSQSLI